MTRCIGGFQLFFSDSKFIIDVLIDLDAVFMRRVRFFVCSELVIQ